MDVRKKNQTYRYFLVLNISYSAAKISSIFCPVTTIKKFDRN